MEKLYADNRGSREDDKEILVRLDRVYLELRYAPRVRIRQAPELVMQTILSFPWILLTVPKFAQNIIREDQRWDGEHFCSRLFQETQAECGENHAGKAPPTIGRRQHMTGLLMVIGCCTTSSLRFMITARYIDTGALFEID